MTPAGAGKRTSKSKQGVAVAARNGSASPGKGTVIIVVACRSQIKYLRDWRINSCRIFTLHP
jgi:hypothetical protein